MVQEEHRAEEEDEGRQECELCEGEGRRKNVSCVKVKAADTKLPPVNARRHGVVSRTRLRVQGRGTSIDAASVNIIISALIMS